MGMGTKQRRHLGQIKTSEQNEEPANLVKAGGKFWEEKAGDCDLSTGTHHMGGPRQYLLSDDGCSEDWLLPGWSHSIAESIRETNHSDGLCVQGHVAHGREGPYTERKWGAMTRA